ncbi:MAG: hypothetical protein ROO76_07470 [Terriglobia bacterium]|nr:hypothetical protein [Terriglobia bacterium]
MYEQRESRFEALVYTENSSLAARCAKAFAEFPADWVMFYDSSFALEYLRKEEFDYLILDLDSAEKGSILIDTLNSGVNLHSVVMAVTSAPVDAQLLDRCYASRVFYPVRPADIQEQLYRTVPLAERLAAERSTARSSGADDAEAEAEQPAISAMAGVLVLALLVGKALAAFFLGVFRMKHSLGILAQERIASLLASSGSVWFVQEMTKNFRGLEFVDPPSAGPSYLIALGLLLWLCAKHRRLSKSQTAGVLARELT